MGPSCVALPRPTCRITRLPPGQGAGEEHRGGRELERRRASGVGQEERGALLPAEGRRPAESQVGAGSSCGCVPMCVAFHFLIVY